MGDVGIGIKLDVFLNTILHRVECLGLVPGAFAREKGPPVGTGRMLGDPQSHSACGGNRPGGNRTLSSSP